MDSAQYQARLNGFDYDVTTGVVQFASPKTTNVFLDCAAAKQNEAATIRHLRSVVDALANAIRAARTREGLVATTPP